MANYAALIIKKKGGRYTVDSFSAAPPLFVVEMIHLACLLPRFCFISLTAALCFVLITAGLLTAVLVLARKHSKSGRTVEQTKSMLAKRED